MRHKHESDINNQACEMRKFLVRWVGKGSKTMSQKENNTARKKAEENKSSCFWHSDLRQALLESKC